MGFDSLRQSLKDVAFTTTTPFDSESENVRLDVIEENLTFCLEAGANVFIPCGNTGEYYSLSHEERIQVVEETVDAVGEEATVVGGLGGSTKTALELLDAYEAAGVDAVMIMDPVHTYVHQSGLQDYYERIISEASVGVVIYKRSHEMPDSLVSELASYENVVGVKYAVNDIKAFSAVVSETDAQVTWINGIAERYAPSFAMEGAGGFTTGIGNFVPAATLELFDAIEREEWEPARQLRENLRPYEDLREETGPNNELEAANNVPVVKHGMELAGLYGGPVREPLVELSSEDASRAESYYKEIDGKVSSPAQ
ncbi:dihydrodipicolinate synthase family protein [Haloferax gibbonsii]|uniref:Dihydrodipicolinate synthetase n=1 Tax=Haloferax gibbonsii TaxID=35746 RepID=A0A0K1IZE4_HALGI|nr:dihydrodipicolinate synthase family protein [Haloferax gibbonsii]AKU09836.1 dihydrodipicolinate synthetase [Haloferax gibbonsii]